MNNENNAIIIGIIILLALLVIPNMKECSMFNPCSSEQLSGVTCDGTEDVGPYFCTEAGYDNCLAKMYIDSSTSKGCAIQKIAYSYMASGIVNYKVYGKSLWFYESNSPVYPSCSNGVCDGTQIFSQSSATTKTGSIQLNPMDYATLVLADTGKNKNDTFSTTFVLQENIAKVTS